MPEDTELLQRFVRQEDQEAFGELVRRRVDFVYSAALRQVGGDDHLARDVTQSVFMAFARSAPRLLGRPTLGGWLYTTTRYLSAKAVRSHRRWRHREQEAQAMRIIDETGAAEPNWEQLRPVLDAAMHQLSASDREAVLLRYFEGLPFGEVGVRCALSENAARMRVERALDKLRIQLEKRGVSSTAAALGLALSSHAVIAAPAGLAAAASGAALAALGSGAAAGLLKFSLSMSTTKITIGVVGALCLVAAGSATYEAAAARRAEASLVQVREADTARIHELQAQVAALKTRAGPTAAATAALSGTGAPTGVTAGDDRNGSAGNGGKPGSHLAALLGTLNGPTVDIPVKIQLENQYAALFKSLNLTPEQADQFKNLLFEKRAAALDTIAAAMGPGDRCDDRCSHRLPGSRRGGKGRQHPAWNASRSGRLQTVSAIHSKPPGPHHRQPIAAIPQLYLHPLDRRSNQSP